MLRVAAGLLRRQGRILVCQRARGGAMPLQWEFPGGKLEPGEDERAALRRELREELGVEVRIGRLFARVRHAYAAGPEVELAVYEVSLQAGEPRNRVFEQIVWELPDRLSTYDFLAADRPLLELLASPPGRTPGTSQC